MTEEEPMRGTLGALIAALRKEDPSLVVSPGLTYPHSYRGFYHDLAFEPTESATVAEVLDLARGAVGRTFGGYKGGDYTMGEYTEVWLSEYGDASGQSIGEEFIRLWLENAHLKKGLEGTGYENVSYENYWDKTLTREYLDGITIPHELWQWMGQLGMEEELARYPSYEELEGPWDVSTDTMDVLYEKAITAYQRRHQLLHHLGHKPCPNCGFHDSGKQHVCVG